MATRHIDELRRQALALSLHDRARLVEDLLRSLGDYSESRGPFARERGLFRRPHDRVA